MTDNLIATGINKPLSLPLNSRWRLSDAFIFEGFRFFGGTDIPNIPITDNDVYYTVKANGRFRIDLIAFDAYGSADMGWIIAAANPGINNLIEDIQAGVVLRIPPLATALALAHR